MAKKTNAVRLVERLGIAYELAEYDIAMEDFSAAAVADLIGVPASQVFKTLVAYGERHGACFAIVAADRELDAKALARANGERRMELVPLSDVEPLTGYRRGGVTAIGARTALPVYLDASAMDHEVIGVSAGIKGLQMLLAPADYVAATDAVLADIQR